MDAVLLRELHELGGCPEARGATRDRRSEAEASVARPGLTPTMSNEPKRFEAIEHTHEHVVFDWCIPEAGFTDSPKDAASSVGARPRAQQITNEPFHCLSEFCAAAIPSLTNSTASFLLVLFDVGANSRD
ncbi:MAG: hypothetical protein WAN75_18890 [Xanthobacteraceae bacterium]